MSSKLIRVVMFAAAIGAGGVAYAEGTQMHPQTHHCKMPDGTMDMKKTHKQCTAAKGTWAKDADAKAPAKDAPAKDAPKDAPKAAPTPAPKK